MQIFNKMKKMLLVAAALFCAGNALAEVKTGSYAVVADDIASGAQITSVEGITMTFGTSDTWTSGSGKVTVDGTAFNVYASTSENCSPTNGAIPTAGPYVVFTPQYDGTLTGIVSNAGNNKNGWIVKDEDNNLVNGTVLIDGAEVAWESGTPYNSAAKYNGGVTFEVEAGATYYFYMGGSKMRFNGFIFTYDDAPADAPATEEVLLTTDIFKAWDGAGADAQPTGAAGCEIHIGEELGTGAMVYGTSTVYYLSYADLSAYSKMVIEGTPGVQLRVMINRLVDEGSVAEGKLTEINVTIGEDGKTEVDFSAYEFVHLNSIKTGWSSPTGTITKISLVEAESTGYDLTAYNEAVAAAEAFKAILEADELFDAEMIAELIVAIDEAIVFAQEGIDTAASQEDVDISTDMLNETIGMYKNNYDAQVAGFKVEEARAAGEAALAKYPEETRSDNAGLVVAMMNLPMRTMGYTAEQLIAAADAVLAAIPAFELENNQLILAAAAKKANDFAATLDISEETGTMAQMEAYNTLAYYASEEMMAQIDASNYDQVMEYSQTVDAMIAQFGPMIEKEKTIMAATTAVAEAEATLAAGGTDEAGLADAIAKVNTILGEINMWDTEYTLADLAAAVEAMEAAEKAFIKDNTIDGVYYMKNVASGQFITAGESWGTCAVFGEHGLDFTITAQADGTYAIDSKISNGGNKNYFGADGWMDAAVAGWNISKLPNGNYTLTANGTSYMGYDAANVWNAQTKVSVNLTDATAEAAQWMLLTKEDMIAALAGANVENPMDATFFISCPNFGRNDTRFPTAWQGGPARGGANDNMCAEKWNCTFDVYQELTGLPNGYYTLSAQGFYRAGNGGTTATEQHALLYANEATAPLVNILAEAGNAAITGNVSTPEGYGAVPNNMATASAAFTAGLYAGNSVGVLVTDGTLRIGVKKDVELANDWTIFDNFELTYHGAKSPIDQYVDSLNALIAEAEEWKTTLDAADEMEGQVIATIDQMIPAAQAVADAAESVETVKEMTTSVYQFMFGTKISLAQMAAQKAQMVFTSIENPTDEAGFEAAITQVFVVSNGMMMGEGAYTMADLDAALAAMEAAEKAFIADNTIGGVYWLKNVASGQFITAGESWGTCAVFGEHGLDFTITEQADGTYAIDSKISNGGNKNYFGADGWMDAAVAGWNISKLPNGNYTLTANGTNYMGYDAANVWNAQTKVSVNLTDATAEAAQWMLLTKEDMIASLAGANVNNPADATFFISCPGFGRNDLRISNWVGSPKRGGANDNMNGEKWNCTFDVYQDLADLPNGYYTLNVQGFYRAGNGGTAATDQHALLYANEVTVPLVNILSEAGNVSGASTVEGYEGSFPNSQGEASAAFTAGYYANNTLTVQVTDGTLRIGVKKDVEVANDWTVFDNFELTYLGEKLTLDLDLAAYEEAVAAAEAFKAVLAADEVTDEMMIEELIVAVDEAIAYAQEGVDAAASQEDVDLAATSLNETIEFYKNNYDKQVAVANAEAVVAEAQAALETYGDVEGAAEVQAGIDNVNELIATFGRPFGGASAEELNAAVNELKAALAAYIGQGAPSVAYLCGATEANDALYAALVAGGCQVTPLNYDDVVLTKKIVEADFVGKYDLVVLGGTTADNANLAKTFDEFIGMIPVLSIKNAWYRQAMSGGVNGGKPGRADAPSLSLVKAEKYAEHPIFAGIEGNEIAVFNDMQKEDGNYLLTNGEFAYDEPEQVTLATVNNNECIGEAWTDGFGWIIIPADAAALTEGALTADGEALIMNAVKYLIAGEQFIVELPYNIAYLCGATETTEDIYTALVAAGHNVTPLNYDEVTLTEEIVANDFVGKYDVVVLAGATGSGTNLAKSANLLVGKVNVLSTKSFWYKHYGNNGTNPGTADAPSRSIVKAAAYAEHPIFAGLAGDEIIVFNDMAKETGRYLQGNGSFANGPAQETLATTNGAGCIGEAWVDGFGYMIVPVDGAQPEGYLTEDGKALFVNIVDYLVNGEQYVSAIEGVTVGATQWPADIYDMSGRMVKKGAASLEGLQKGLYFVNGKKYLVK